MFQDRTLNWSFAASVCANLMLVSLVGGSDLLKTPAGGIFSPIHRLPFIMTVPPPVVIPPIVKIKTMTTRLKPIVHPEAHSTARTASRPRPATPAAAKPVKVARLDVGTRRSNLGNVAVDNGNQPVGDQSGESRSSGTVAGPVVQHPFEYDEDFPPTPPVPQDTHIPQMPTIRPDAPKTPFRKPTLADREDPEQLSAFADITSSVQFDPATLTSIAIVVQFEVGTDGRASDIKVIKSSGNSDLDQNAIDAIKAMRWKPAVQDGVARSVTLTHEFDVSN